ncbi:MAG: Rpn family recombination-promoting nuclease/putative transposase [Clostridiales Family XIII bacterium]|jgi:predicted transposase/invertase (TIGR01784 family)|nr:Rpn family recombination-promoting nuclease/putative transposase [Clostridiales Family XIII bacterium]
MVGIVIEFVSDRCYYEKKQKAAKPALPAQRRYSERAFRKRIVYKISKVIEEQLGKGDGYGKIHEAICIVITEFTLIRENGEYHNRYRYYDERTGSTFSDIATIHVFELAKLAKAEGDEPILDWLRFLDSDEVKNMEAIAEKNEGVRRAVTKYKELTASENARILAQLREKDRLLEKGRLDYAWDEGVAEGVEKGRSERNAEIARRMADLGKTDAEIAEILGDV